MRRLLTLLSSQVSVKCTICVPRERSLSILALGVPYIIGDILGRAGISHKTPKRKKTKTKTKPSIVFDSGGSIQPDSQKRTLATFNIKNLRKTAEKNN